jgi:hypothetical protein
LLPPRNTLLHPLDLPEPYDRDVLYALVANILQDVTGVEVFDLSCDMMSPSSVPHHVTSVPPPHLPNGVLVAARSNTWSRAARRKAQVIMATGDLEECNRPASLVCRIDWTDQLESGHHKGEKRITHAVLGVNWVRGRDRAMFESFTSHVVKKVRMELVPRKIISS